MAVNGSRQGGGGGDDHDKIHRRATWLNANVFADRPIDQEAVAAMIGLGVGRAFELFKEIEGKADQMKSPSGYLKKAASREGSGGGIAAAAPGGGFAAAPNGSNDERTIHRRATWLNSNVFPDRPIDQDAIGAMLGMGVSRALELFKEIEEKASQMKNPSGYLKKAAEREGFSPAGMPMPPPPPRASSVTTPRRPPANAFAGNQAATTEDQKNTIHRRVTWLNSNVFKDRPIDNDTIGAMMGMGVARALELFKEIEEKAVRNPNGYLQTAAVREGLCPPGLSSPRGGGPGAAGPRMSSPALSDDERSKVFRRATWLNANVFPDRHIDQEATNAMLGLGVPRALELFKEIEEKADTLRNPSGYLKAAAQREGGGGGGGGYQGGGAVPSVGRGMASHHHPVMSEDERNTIHRRATWINKNVFKDRPIDGGALDAMMGMGVARALELFKEIEEKSVRNPSGYLITAAQREGFGAPGLAPQQMQMMMLPPQAATTDEEQTTIHRRATWLNKNVFQGKQIDNDAIGAMMGLGVGRALELFKEIEEKAAQLKNPSGYLKKAADREGLGLPALQMGGGAGPAAMYAQPALTEQESSTIHRRVTWLNANVFKDRQIDQEAVSAMMGLGVARALELFKEIEGKADQMRNPSGYLKKAAANEGVSPEMMMYGGQAGRQFDPVRGKADWDKIHRKVTWMNSNVFPKNHIDPEAIEALASLGVERAFEILSEIQEKGDEVKNPSGYLKTAVSREWAGGSPKGGRKRPAPGGGDGGSSSKRSKGTLMLV